MPKRKHWIRDATLRDLDGQPFRLNVDGQLQQATLAQLLRQSVRLLPVRTVEDSETGREVLRACKAALDEAKGYIELEEREYGWLQGKLADLGLGIELDGAVRDALRDELRPEQRPDHGSERDGSKEEEREERRA